MDCQRLSRQQDAIESVHEQESAQPLASLALVHSQPAEHHGRHGVARQTLCLVCREAVPLEAGGAQAVVAAQSWRPGLHSDKDSRHIAFHVLRGMLPDIAVEFGRPARECRAIVHLARSEEHTSELQSLMRISYAVFCLKTKNKT